MVVQYKHPTLFFCPPLSLPPLSSPPICHIRFPPPSHCGLRVSAPKLRPRFASPEDKWCPPVSSATRCRDKCMGVRSYTAKFHFDLYKKLFKRQSLISLLHIFFYIKNPVDFFLRRIDVSMGLGHVGECWNVSVSDTLNIEGRGTCRAAIHTYTYKCTTMQIRK